MTSISRFAALLALLCTAGAGPVVRTAEGFVEGLQVGMGRAVVFRGIPYAAPPTGPLRWQPPQRHQPWQGVLNATVSAQDCETAEDCLYLNVFAPSDPQNVTLPVMVWVHGGCYVSGAGSLFIYSGEPDVAAYKDVVIVTLNYRLGVFGFLGSREIQQRATDGSAGNFGLQDQRMAFDWVQRNIAAFGGNPNNVMIFGQSAGAGSVSAHLTMPKSWPYFHKAVLESGAMAQWNSLPLSVAEQTYQWLLTHVKCADVGCLLQQSFATLHSATDAAPGFCQYHARFAAVVDGVELTDEIFVLASEGKHANVPVMVGSTLDEGFFFVPLPHNATEQQYLEYLPKEYNATVAAGVPNMYPPSSYKKFPYFVSAMRAWTDVFMGCNSRRAARWLSAKGAPVYFYFFTHAPVPVDWAFHGAEIPFVFRLLDLLVLDGPEARVLANALGQYWTNFAYSSNPNTPIPGHTPPRVSWPRFDAQTVSGLQLDFTIKPITQWHQETCDYWDSVVTPGCQAPPPGWQAPC